MSETVKKLDERVLANIVRAEITEEDTGDVYVFTTSSEASIKPYASEGTEKIHRVKNTILASLRYEDILLGYEIKLVNNTFCPELLALVDGGEVTNDEDGNFVSYAAPVVGKVTERKNLTVALYTEELDCDGETLEYIKFTFRHAKGKPVEYSIKDGEFFIPELTLHSRAKTGESSVSVEVLKNID
ncbi:MAG: hypothetical protein IKB50_01680 [Clostridia bacterium]|nr:hypothetical protein [Clostridia bacterium]